MNGRRIVRGDVTAPLIAAAIPGLPAIDTAAMRRVTDRFDKQMETLTQQLLDGAITPDEWRLQAARAVRELHTLLYAVGNNKRPDKLSAADKAALAGLIAAQLLYLFRWSKQIQELLATGKLLPTLAAFLARATQYRNAGNATVQKAQTGVLGFTLPVYPGERSACKTNCRCKWRIEKVGEADYDCTWVVLHDKEICPQCVRRGQVWAPLKVRNNVLETYDLAGLFQ